MLAELLIPRATLESCKERFGFGQSIVVLTQGLPVLKDEKSSKSFEGKAA